MEPFAVAFLRYGPLEVWPIGLKIQWLTTTMMSMTAHLVQYHLSGAVIDALWV